MKNLWKYRENIFFLLPDFNVLFIRNWFVNEIMFFKKLSAEIEVKYS